MSAPKYRPATSPKPCRYCGGKVIAIWERDYRWPEGVARTRFWHCLGSCRRSAPQRIGPYQAEEGAQP